LTLGLQQGATSAVGKVSVFAAYDGAKFDISAANNNPQTNSKNRAATVGVTMRVSEAVTVGVAIGKNTNDVTMGSLGQYELDETAFSLFASAKVGGFYGNATFSNADLKFNGIRRNVRLGLTTRANNASTNGSNTSGSVMAGYDFQFGGVSVGPFVGMTSQSVSVGGFQENANAAVALSTDLRLSEQSRISRVTSVGIRASATIGNFTPYARVSFDSDGNNNERFITASPVTIAQNIKYDIPGYRGDGKWVTGVIGIRGNITQQIGLGLSYSAVSSKEGVKQDGVTANVNFAF
jgi:outer membrane lipase/esterase